jgi:hypothetical protein
MSLFTKLLGTVSSFFQIGGPRAPGLSNDGGSGNIGAYNSSQSAYVNVRGADPVVSNDFVTLEYGNANYGGGSSGVPLVVSGTYTVATNTQVLFASPIIISADGVVLTVGTGVLVGIS